MSVSNKHLIKIQDKIHILFGNKLVYLHNQDTTQEQFERFGMDTLVGYENPIDKVAHEMEDVGILGEGRLFRQPVNFADVVKKIEDVEGFSLIKIDGDYYTIESGNLHLISDNDELTQEILEGQGIENLEVLNNERDSLISVVPLIDYRDEGSGKVFKLQIPYHNVVPKLISTIYPNTGDAQLATTDDYIEDYSELKFVGDVKNVTTRRYNK